jgi:hypothetical protein
VSALRKIATITILGETYDLAANGKATLARERQDIYGRPFAEVVEFDDLPEPNIVIAQVLLDLLAEAIKDRDAAREALQRNES